MEFLSIWNSYWLDSKHSNSYNVCTCRFIYLNITIGGTDLEDDFINCLVDIDLSYETTSSDNAV